MSPKILLFVFGFLALGSVIEAKHFFKNLREKALHLQRASHSGDKALDSLLRKRRSTDETDSSEPTDEADFMKFFMAEAWKNDKLDILAGFLEEMTDHDTNLTVIGWQRILGEDGKVEQINTVQLVIPPRPIGETDHNIVDYDDDDDDEEEDDDRRFPYGKISEMREVFEPMAQLGIPASVTMEELNREGKNEILIYLDKDELYAKADNFSVYNKTAEATPEEIKAFIKSLKPTILGEPSVLKYDVDGHLDVENSKINPAALGGVIDFYETPDKILVEGPQIIARISQQYPQAQIPRELALHYNKAYPEYKWRVLVDPSNYYITRDVSITLTYDNFDLDEASDISYLVYGVKNEAKPK